MIKYETLSPNEKAIFRAGIRHARDIVMSKIDSSQRADFTQTRISVLCEVNQTLNNDLMEKIKD